MTDTDSDSGKERKVLSQYEASELAEKYKHPGEPDPFPWIRPSLLSADHIRDYVMETGAIAPFYLEGGRRSRLKKASYEGRIGGCAYRYNKEGMLESVPLVGELEIGANSIVFVECDLDFRLPDFIALRFNLQIRHVHRGLLLGTGPLVDPGYKGKLCIPLHNLTDEDYSIPLEDGLIWIEFTKTTSNQDRSDSLGRLPLDENEGYWEIRDFVERAARPIKGTGASVPIRSSISKVRDEAESAANRASEARRWVSGIGIGGAIVAAVGLIALAFGFAAFIQDAYSSLTPRIDDLEKRFSHIEIVTTDTGSRNLSSAVKDLTRENQDLHKRLGDLERILGRPARRMLHHRDDTAVVPVTDYRVCCRKAPRRKVELL